MILGLRTAIYPVADLDAAKPWDSDVLGQAPYFDQPFYVGFEVGGGIKVASVRDPFGNRFGLIQNPLFDVKRVR